MFVLSNYLLVQLLIKNNFGKILVFFLLFVYYLINLIVYCINKEWRRTKVRKSLLKNKWHPKKTLIKKNMSSNHLKRDPKSNLIIGHSFLKTIIK